MSTKTEPIGSAAQAPRAPQDIRHTHSIFFYINNIESFGILTTNALACKFVVLTSVRGLQN